MSQYRKKPVVIEAMQFVSYRSADKIIEWSGGAAAVHEGDPSPERPSFLVIQTVEGEMTASGGDWIIKGVKGEFYPCKPDIFEMTYEALP